MLGDNCNYGEQLVIKLKINHYNNNIYRTIPVSSLPEV